MTPELSLGFDCRDVRPSAVRARWAESRRQQFLLKPDIRCPISVDTIVLPSLFPDFNAIADDLAPAVECVPVEWDRRVITRSWSDLATMVEILKRHGMSISDPGFFLLETVLHRNENVVDHPLWLGLMSVEPASAGQVRASPAGEFAVEFAGFDVADASGISALMNCGYRENEVSELRSAWKSRLNDSGLIVSIEDAQEFTSISNKRISEHAPFAVFALHRWKFQALDDARDESS